MRRGRGGEGLLDLFGAGEVSQNGRTFDCSAAFQVETRGPSVWKGEVGGTVAGTEVKKGYLVGFGGVVVRGVDQGTRGVGGGDGGAI